jgi:hypothetical protein
MLYGSLDNGNGWVLFLIAIAVALIAILALVLIRCGGL